MNTLRVHQIKNGVYKTNKPIFRNTFTSVISQTLSICHCLNLCGVLCCLTPTARPMPGRKCVRQAGFGTCWVSLCRWRWWWLTGPMRWASAQSLNCKCLCWLVCQKHQAKPLSSVTHQCDGLVLWVNWGFGFGCWCAIFARGNCRSFMLKRGLPFAASLRLSTSFGMVDYRRSIRPLIYCGVKNIEGPVTNGAGTAAIPTSETIFSAMNLYDSALCWHDSSVNPLDCNHHRKTPSRLYAEC